MLMIAPDIWRAVMVFADFVEIYDHVQVNSGDSNLSAVSHSFADDGRVIRRLILVLLWPVERCFLSGFSGSQVGAGRP
jgi:hypothetical protein